MKETKTSLHPLGSILPQQSKMHLASSIEDVSILRKFTILFMLMSVIPTTLLYYVYTQVKNHGTVNMSAEYFNITLIFVLLGVIVGYISMRKVLGGVVSLLNENRKMISNVLPEDKLDELKGEKNEITVLSQSFAAINKRLEDNVRNLEATKKKLHVVMSKVGYGIANMQNINTFLELILETVTNALAGKVGVLMLVDEEANELWVKMVYGIDYDLSKVKRVKIEEGTTIHSVIHAKKPLIVPRMMMAGFAEVESSTNSLFASPMICAPLMMKDKVKGVLVVSGREEEGNFDEDEMNLLLNLASQTAIALENSTLNKDIEVTYFETVSALALAVDAKDTYSRGHLDRVAAYCVQIAEKLGLEQSDIKTLRDAARLHDLGKIGIPDNVLSKPGALSDEEWILMKKHPEIGEGIIQPVKSLRHLCDIVRHHHEKLDGKGYPDGLKGDEITPLVRITTVADIFDALTTDRSYRKGFPRKKAIEIMKGMEGEIDFEVLNVFIETLDVDADDEI